MVIYLRNILNNYEEIPQGNRGCRYDPAGHRHRGSTRLGLWLRCVALRRRLGFAIDTLPLQGLPLEGIRAGEQAVHCHSAHLHPTIVPTNAENEMTIKEAQKAVDRWIREYGVRYFSELTNMAVLTEEVGELARVIARKYGDQSFKPGEKDNLGEEMADVLWVLLCLANQTGVDLTEELQKSIEKKTQRDSLRHIQNKKLLA